MSKRKSDEGGAPDSIPQSEPSHICPRCGRVNAIDLGPLGPERKGLRQMLCNVCNTAWKGTTRPVGKTPTERDRRIVALLDRSIRVFPVHAPRPPGASEKLLGWVIRQTVLNAEGQCYLVFCGASGDSREGTPPLSGLYETKESAEDAAIRMFLDDGTD